jgi:hypothetical protein
MRRTLIFLGFALPFGHSWTFETKKGDWVKVFAEMLSPHTPFWALRPLVSGSFGCLKFFA